MHDLPPGPDASRSPCLNTWNDTEAPYPTHRCVHQLFEDWVRRTPGAVALSQKGRQITYAELNAQANRLAHRMIALGVRPDVRIGICVERRSHLIIGLLAILKAGGAYVPLDPAYPNDRLR